MEIAPSSLLSELEVAVSAVKEEAEKGPITDETPQAVPLLRSIEKILRHGIKASGSFFGGGRDYWNWIENLSKNDALHYEISHASSLLQAKTAQGKGRAFIRYALMQKSLADAIQLLLVDEKLRKDFYTPKAFLSNEYCSNALINLLYELSQLTFNFNHETVDIDNEWVNTNKKRSSSITSIASTRTQVVETGPTIESLEADLKIKANEVEKLKFELQSKMDTKDDIIRELNEKIATLETHHGAAEFSWKKTKIELINQLSEITMELKNEKRFHEATKAKQNIMEVPTTGSESTNISLENENLIEMVEDLSKDDIKNLQNLTKSLRSEWQKEKQRNVLIESTELKEKEFFYQQLVKDGNSESVVAMIKKKDEEISDLESELSHRKKWIIEMEKQKTMIGDSEMRLSSELRDLKRQLEVEKKKSEELEKSYSALQTNTSQEATTMSTRLEETKKERDGYKRSFEDLQVQREGLLKENSALRDELNVETSARKQLEDSVQSLEQELQKLSTVFESETSQLGELVSLERKAKDEFVMETQKLLLEFQKEVEQEKTRRVVILKQLEAERHRISMQKWAKDEGVLDCTSCKSEFTMFRRRHHCRACGNIFCHNCSSKTALTAAGPRPVRVCDDCYSRIEGIEPPPGSTSSLLDEKLTEASIAESTKN